MWCFRFEMNRKWNEKNGLKLKLQKLTKKMKKSAKEEEKNSKKPNDDHTKWRVNIQNQKIRLISHESDK